MAWTYQDKEIEEGKAWKGNNGVNYSPQWAIWSDEEKVAAGLVEVVEEIPERSLDDAKSEKIVKIKSEQRVRLSSTDWVIIRKTDAGTAIPSNIQNHRDAIRAKATEMENTINAESDIDSVDAFNIVWPKLSDS
tara:strand:+ start:760 stop:1161 length:402 start_codon:yes stop_codon:yes gene_type:complete